MLNRHMWPVVTNLGSTPPDHTGVTRRLSCGVYFILSWNPTRPAHPVEQGLFQCMSYDILLRSWHVHMPSMETYRFLLTLTSYEETTAFPSIFTHLYCSAQGSVVPTFHMTLDKVTSKLFLLARVSDFILSSIRSSRCVRYTLSLLSFFVANSSYLPPSFPFLKTH